MSNSSINIHKVEKITITNDDDGDKTAWTTIHLQCEDGSSMRISAFVSGYGLEWPELERVK